MLSALYFSAVLFCGALVHSHSQSRDHQCMCVCVTSCSNFAIDLLFLSWINLYLRSCTCLHVPSNPHYIQTLSKELLREKNKCFIESTIRSHVTETIKGYFTRRKIRINVSSISDSVLLHNYTKLLMTHCTCSMVSCLNLIVLTCVRR